MVIFLFHIELRIQPHHYHYIEDCFEKQMKNVILGIVIVILTVVLVQVAIANPSEEDKFVTNKFCLAQNIYFESTFSIL